MSPYIKINTKVIDTLRYSLAAVYIFFGVLKFFPGMSPADMIAKETINVLTLGFLPDRLSIILLAIIECSFGLLLVWRKWMRFVVPGIFTHLTLAFSPFLIFPDATFEYMPYRFTLLGQYIFKNVILICSAWILWQSECSALGEDNEDAISGPKKYNYKILKREKNKKKEFH